VNAHALGINNVNSLESNLDNIKSKMLSTSDTGLTILTIPSRQACTGFWKSV
jgi:hypothetical protein